MSSLALLYSSLQVRVHFCNLYFSELVELYPNLLALIELLKFIEAFCPSTNLNLVDLKLTFLRRSECSIRVILSYVPSLMYVVWIFAVNDYLVLAVVLGLTLESVVLTYIYGSSFWL